MADYQLELRQIVDYPRCRIYREFMQTLIADRSIRTGGCSGLFYYVVLCSYGKPAHHIGTLILKMASKLAKCYPPSR